MADVKVEVTVVRRSTHSAVVTLLVDEDEDQWTTLVRAEKLADVNEAWQEGELYIDRFNSSVRIAK